MKDASIDAARGHSCGFLTDNCLILHLCFALKHCSHAGLTSAMYLRDGREVPSPDPAAGLYIRTRRHGIVQARIPADQLAYQIGEASQVCSAPQWPVTAFIGP